MPLCQSVLSQCAFNIIEFHECECSASPHVTVRWQRCPEGFYKPQRYFKAAGSRYVSIVLTVRSLETRPCGRSGGCVQPNSRNPLSNTAIAILPFSNLDMCEYRVSCHDFTMPSIFLHFFVSFPSQKLSLPYTFIRLDFQYHELIFLSNMKKVG